MFLKNQNYKIYKYFNVKLIKVNFKNVKLIKVYIEKC
jgi:hypothetical protein